MIYYGIMNIHNTNCECMICDCNLQRTIKDIKKIAKDNCNEGQTYTWKVTDKDDLILAAGSATKRNDKWIHLNVKHLIGEYELPF